MIAFRFTKPRLSAIPRASVTSVAVITRPYARAHDPLRNLVLGTSPDNRSCHQRAADMCVANQHLSGPKRRTFKLSQQVRARVARVSRIRRPGLKRLRLLRYQPFFSHHPSTARVNRPTPRIDVIEPTSEVVTGKQFFVKIKGQDLEPETLAIEVTGPGCPEATPCKVPNSALRDHAKFSDLSVENVPLTLSSGSFKVFARNGDSPPSQPVLLTIP